MNNIILTVFTPTYNRADLLSRGYEALTRQSCKRFRWLIIDDGSKDNTEIIVKTWISADSYKENNDGFEGLAENKGFPIRYVKKENGGLHTGYNKAIELMDTEICVCIDSDDYMPDDAVKIILDRWKKYNNGKIAGLIGLDYTIQGERLGAEFDEGRILHCVELKQEKRYRFDNKVVLRVDLLKKVAPQPSFFGEKNFNPMWMILKVDQMFPFVLINENFCFVDYQNTGMAANIINQYFNSPNSFVELRRLHVNLKYTTLIWRFKNYIHLVAEAKIAGRSPYIDGVNKILVTIAYPLGILLYKYLCFKRK